jgi:hypothetical protein
MWRINEWFTKERRENDPLCVPIFPSTCQRRYRMLAKNPTEDLAKDFLHTCRKCHDLTGGRNHHVQRMNELIRSIVGP